MNQNGYIPLSTTEDSHITEPITRSASGELCSRVRASVESKRASVVTFVRNFFHNNYGLILVIGAEGCISMTNVGVKKLNSIDLPVPVFELIVIRMTFTWIFSVGLMFYQRVENPFIGPKGVRSLLLLRGLSGFFGVFGIYQALEWISLSDATVLTFLAPLCTAISGSIFLNETFSRSQAVAGLTSLFGVVLIARPVSIFGRGGHVPEAIGSIRSESNSETGNPEHRLLAVGISLIGVMGTTIAFTCLRAIGKRAHALHSLVSFSFQSAIVASIGMIVTKTPFVLPIGLVWYMFLLVIGVFGFLAQMLLTIGFQYEQAGRATTAVYTQIVWATVFERIWFHTSPSLLSIIGTLIIIGSALYVALNKKREGNEDNTTITLERLGDGINLEEGLSDDSRRAEGTKPSLANQNPEQKVQSDP
ncbi:hypothetical protein E1B28_007410 [Marasmius oreades]|uniref:EamA domain-containing protein n=1 Tax=Marasmius oreades TaxID=181124 RepID=A0A9P7S1K6_9AGAR|nr:uncharacterized protein E1B28_007410 [Marasmius oreades]KAG7093761.1 hypothetical protein E1B28_007410 [Marasmius oreades]